MKKKIKLLDIEYWYPYKGSCQPMLTFGWKSDTEAAINLMASSDYLFAISILEDKTIPETHKKLFYEMAKSFIKEYEKFQSKSLTNITKKHA